MWVRVAPPGGCWHTVSGSYSERLHRTDSFSPGCWHSQALGMTGSPLMIRGYLHSSFSLTPRSNPLLLPHSSSATGASSKCSGISPWFGLLEERVESHGIDEDKQTAGEPDCHAFGTGSARCEHFRPTLPEISFCSDFYASLVSLFP